MTQITLDAAVVSQFESTQERAEVRDPTGRVLGYFEPLRPLRAGEIPVPFTDEELEQFRREPGGRSLDEILRELESRV